MRNFRTKILGQIIEATFEFTHAEFIAHYL